MIMVIYRRTWAAMKRNFWQLLGLVWLGSFLAAVAGLLGGPILGIGIGAGWLFSVGLVMIFLRSFRGEQVNSVQLFDYFSDWKTIKRILCGMGWQVLHLLLWLLIPVVGVVFFFIRAYEYRLTPYILAAEPDISPTVAIKVSRARTMGYKGAMFGADMLIVGGFWVIGFVIGFIGGFFDADGFYAFMMLLLIALEIVVLPVFTSLLQSAFYDEIMNPTMNTTSYTDKFCTQCGAPLPGNASYCSRCGNKIQ